MASFSQSSFLTSSLYKDTISSKSSQKKISDKDNEEQVKGEGGDAKKMHTHSW